jgi:hypothetical protein
MRAYWNSLIIVMIALPGGGLAAPVPTPRPNPCAAVLEGPDYVPGVDAEGHDVARADIGAPRVSVPDTVYVPLPGQGRGQGRGRGPGGRGQANPPYAAIDGRRLDPLLNPSTCPR